MTATPAPPPTQQVPNCRLLRWHCLLLPCTAGWSPWLIHAYDARPSSEQTHTDTHRHGVLNAQASGWRYSMWVNYAHPLHPSPPHPHPHPTSCPVSRLTTFGHYGAPACCSLKMLTYVSATPHYIISTWSQKTCFSDDSWSHSIWRFDIQWWLHNEFMLLRQIETVLLLFN